MISPVLPSLRHWGRRRVVRDLVSVVTGNGVGTVLSAVATVAVARSLGPAAWGVAASATSLALAVSAALVFGVQQRGIRDLASGRVTSDEWVQTFAGMTLLAVGAAALMPAILTLAPYSSALAVAIGLLSALLLMRQLVVVPHMSTRNFGLTARVVVLERSIVVAAVLILVASAQMSAVTYVASQAVAASVALAILWPRLAFHALFKRFRNPLSSWRVSSPFGLAALTGALAPLDIVLVQAVAGHDQAGYFAIAGRVLGPLAVVGSAAATVALPVASGRRSLPRPSIKSCLVVAVLAACALSAAWVAVPPALTATVGAAYVPAVFPVRLYMLVTALTIVNQPLIAILQARGREGLAWRLLVVGTTIHLAGALLGGALHGAAGAAFGLLISNMWLLATCSVALVSVWHWTAARALGEAGGNG